MFIAHINQSGEKQSLDEHLQGVAESCALSAKKLGLSNTARLAGLLHDMGKVSSRFTDYILYSHSHPGDQTLRGKVIHSTQGAKYIYNEYGQDQALDRLTSSIIAALIAGHHGGLMDCVSPEGEQPLFDRITSEDPRLDYDEVKNQFSQSCSQYPEIASLFGNAKNEIKAFADREKSQNLEGLFYQHFLIKLLFSYLIDADRYDSYRFEAGLPVKAEISDMPPWNDLSISLESHLAGFDLTKPINRLRTEISDRCREAASLPGGVYRLSVPTGGGKTLSSLRFALEHARLHNKERIFYIIPYTTIIDQNAAEIRRILKRDDLILEHHSNVIRENWPWDQNSEEDEADYNLLTEQWSSPIILTTMVQFLNSLYAGGTRAARRMHRLTNSVLVFDEVQATPVSCIHLLTGALNFLSGLCNTTVLLCTATQPELTEVERPLRILGECQIVGSLDDQFNIFKRNRVIDSRKDGGYTINDLSLFTIDKLSDLMTGLIILNTKDAARKLYLEIEQWNQSLNDSEQYNLFYLSTSLCPAHRKELLAEIQSLLHGGKVICISTQLIEAGIDISFQCVIRAVAGLDSIAQAAGRCNRHKEYEGCRDVFIVNLAGENLKHLPDMLAGRQAAEDILNNMKKDPALYGGDPVSPAAVRAYYLRFNQYVKGKMDYPVPDVSPNATLIDLLGSNKLGCHARCMRELPLPPLKQAFAAAGKNFQVIESGTEAVIVPYGEGADILTSLRDDLPLNERKKLIRQAQQYCVNLFPWEKIQLDHEHALEMLPGGEMALAPEFYDDKHLGLMTAGQVTGNALFA